MRCPLILRRDGSINRFLISKTLYSNWCIFIWPEQINQPMNWEEGADGCGESGETEDFEGHRTLNLILYSLISLWSSLILKERIQCPRSNFKEQLTGFVVVWKLPVSMCLELHIVLLGFFLFVTFSPQHIFYLIISSAETCHIRAHKMLTSILPNTLEANWVTWPSSQWWNTSIREQIHAAPNRLR